MSVFQYNPAYAKSWSEGVIECLTGSSDSIKVCSDKFSQAINDLKNPLVWRGPGAKENLLNFRLVHNSLVEVMNNFGKMFRETMQSFNTEVRNLESANTGGSYGSFGANFGELNFTAIADFDEGTLNAIDTETAAYDYNTIVNILGDVKSTIRIVDEVFSKIKTKANELDNGSGQWDGVHAAQMKEEINRIISKYQPELTQLLNKCHESMTTAAENARPFSV